MHGGVEIAFREKPLRRIQRWLRNTFGRPRRIPLMLEPEPAALDAWRSLLGIARKGRT